MLTFVVTTDRAALLDYCDQARVHPRAVRLVQSPEDLAAAKLGENRLEFWGNFRRLPRIDEIVERAKAQVLEDLAKIGSSP